ncbi:MAG: DUF4382 domain-containing protein [Gammaproteobacteria bacterium]|nr:DUF4382 domain-containing protein [Gammaproteobacteria bacterium]MDE2346118.1 DUF4382 domain-containing protein [Gammaproteobacteria bacterium]
MNLSVSDTPVDGAQHVVVAFTGVELMGPNGQQDFSFGSEKTVDFIQQQGTNSAALLSGVTVSAGAYQWIRLQLDLTNSYIITSSGTQYPLTIPSGSQTGLKLVSGFTVAAGSTSNFLIDFDLRKSLSMSNKGGATTYMLSPTMRLVNMQQVGNISGSVSPTLSIGGTTITATNCDPAVYAYPDTASTLEGFYVTIKGGTPPLTSASVSLDNNTGNYVYTVGFLAPGTYDLAVTCAAYDIAGSNNLPVFSTQTATVTAGSTTIINF